MKTSWILILLVFIMVSCGDDNTPVDPPVVDELTVFFFNDQHGEIDHFAKVKAIVDEAKLDRDVLLVCGGDAFSGNPIVDQYEDKGFPMIDLMNRIGVDVAAIGNHEFDYGQQELTARINQSEFPWICANIDMGTTGIPEPEDFVTLTVGGLKVTFFGFVETNGKDNLIPSTHPWKVEGIQFPNYTTVVDDYQNLREEEESDLLIALTHLGISGDLDLASNYDFMDAVIGGHNHILAYEVVNEIPVVQAGSDLDLLGRIDFSILEGNVIDADVSFQDLHQEDLPIDVDLQLLIDQYNNNPSFSEVVGTATSYHEFAEIGCFYTDALRQYMNVDFSIQNSGGIRAEIDQGDITAFEIYSMDPFNNGSVIFTKTVGEYKDFFCTDGGFYAISGVEIVEEANAIRMFREDGTELMDSEVLTIGMNDFIPANHPDFFPISEADIQDLTTAETIIQYLATINGTIDFTGCDSFFNCD